MSAASFADWQSLFGDRPVVVDGGLSTQLERRGHDIAGELWTGRVLLDDPTSVVHAHRDFIDAGADVVITASYQVSRQGFVEVGMTPDQADAALRASVAAARSAVGDRAVRVAASVGPYGAILHDGSEYRGNYGLSRAELYAFHRDRIAVLVEARPDLLAVETIPDVLEAEAIAEVLGEYEDVPAWMTFSAADAERLWAGQAIEAAVIAAASAPNVIAVGVNCTDPRYATELIARIRGATDLSIVAYPNAGGAWDSVSGEWDGAHGAQFAPSLVSRWQAAGARAVGGCCGTDDRAIRQIAAVLAGTRS